VKWLPLDGRKAAAVHKEVKDWVKDCVRITAGIVNPGHYDFARGFVQAVELNVTVGGVEPVTGGIINAGAVLWFISSTLAAHPVEQIKFTVDGYEPVVTFGFRHLSSGWQATLHAKHDPSRVTRDRTVMSGHFQSRRVFLSYISEFVASHLSALTFEETIPF
jgi:hypothetical protein